MIMINMTGILNTKIEKEIEKEIVKEIGIKTLVDIIINMKTIIWEKIEIINLEEKILINLIYKKIYIIKIINLIIADLILLIIIIDIKMEQEVVMEMILIIDELFIIYNYY